MTTIGGEQMTSSTFFEYDGKCSMQGWTYFILMLYEDKVTDTQDMSECCEGLQFLVEREFTVSPMAMAFTFLSNN